MRLSSTVLFEVAHKLRAAALVHESRLTLSDWNSNSGLAITAAATREIRLVNRQQEAVSEMRAVATALEHTAEAIEYVESDIDRLIRQVDSATQHSSDFLSLLNELRALGDALDRACAQHIKMLCTPQLEDGEALTEFSQRSLEEIDAAQREHAPEEVLRLLEHYPEAKLLPSSDGVVIAFGNIDTAPAVVTLVPGVGSANPTDWPGYAERASRMATGGNASVLWIDYSAPSSVPAAVSTAPAAIGATRLREFQAELRRRAARKGNEQHLTVLGHSYGSVVAGYAAQQGLHANAVVFAGSPGVGADTAAELDLHADSPAIVSTTSPHDPIGLAVAAGGGAHGPDPADPRFGAEVWPASGGHSNYWNDPEFYRRLAELSQRNSN